MNHHLECYAATLLTNVEPSKQQDLHIAHYAIIQELVMTKDLQMLNVLCAQMIFVQLLYMPMARILAKFYLGSYTIFYF